MSNRTVYHSNYKSLDFVEKHNVTRLFRVIAVSICIGSISQQVFAETELNSASSTPSIALENTTLTKPNPVSTQSKTLYSDSSLSSDKTEPLETVEFSAEEDTSDTKLSNYLSTSENAPPKEITTKITRRVPAPPIDSPPFPSGEWQIGGTSPIGAPDTSSTYTLMKLLHKTELGSFLEKNRIKIYGWVNTGANYGTSKLSNYPVTYNTFSRRVDLDQVAINIERIPNTVQTEHVDWGFRVTGFYGIDYRLTTMKGIFSDQLLTKNRQYGFDPVLFYGDIYLPKVAKGMNIRIGRYLSVPDIEAQLCPDNYMYTHSLLYGVDPYTQMGIMTTTKLNDQWNIQLGISGGNDIALWAGNRKNLLKPTGTAMVQWISKKNKDSIYAGVNAINDGKYAYNNLQHFVATWTHVFTPKIHTKTEAYYMYQRQVPGIGFAPEWAIVNYTLFQLSKKDYITFRNEYYDDIKGQRYGVKNSMSSHAIGYTHWFNQSIGIRPEFRYDQAYNNPTFDHFKKKNQFLGSVDLIVRF